MRFVKRNANKCMTWGGVLLSKKGIIPIFVVILTILTILISVGYSALNQNLSVSGEAFLRAKDNIRISRIELSDAANDGYETYNPEYSKRTTKMYTTLPKDDSSVTYTVKVTNSTGIRYKVGSIDVTSTNPNVSCTPSIEKDSVIDVGVVKFTVTANYKDGMSQDTNLNACDIKYEFVSLDVTPPTLSVQLVKDNGNTKTIKIIAEDEADGSGISDENNFKYYLSTSSTTLTGGEWKNYTNNTEFEISGNFEVKYLWIYPVKDKAGNINDGKANIDTAYLIETYTFIDNRPTLYNVIAKESLTGGVAKLYTKQHNDTYNEIGTKNIYYFNGSNSTQAAEVLTKNNVIFAGFCWQMIRTTDTGGVKLIYNGVPKEADGKSTCTNSGEEQQIGTSAFNQHRDSPAYVGYMYNAVYSSKTKNMMTTESMLSGVYSLSTSYWYADSISYNSLTRTYSLVNPYQVSSTSDYVSLKGKYTFGNSTETYNSSSVYYIGGINNNSYYRIILSSGNTIEYYDDVYTYGTSYTKNEDGTYTINDPLIIQKTTYYDNYADLREKYVCKNAVDNSCNALWYVTSSNGASFDWVDPENEYKFAKGFTYSETDNKYMLNDEFVMIFDFDNSNEKVKLNNAHYTCFNTTGECETIYYIYYLSGKILYYIELNNGTSIENALQEMFSVDNVNQTNSTIKDAIDTWYANNMTNYTEYLEDTVFCNDRSILYYSGWNPNGGSISYHLRFKSYSYSTSDLYCTNVTDRFSVGNEKAKLTYPVGLMSIPEIYLLGNNNIGKTGKWYWLTSPKTFESNIAQGGSVYTNGAYNIVTYINYSNLGVRPSVSLASDTQYAAGTGSTTDPYIVDVSAPTVTQETLIDGEREKTVRVTISDDYGLSSDNQYKYYLSTSETELAGGAWKDYTFGEIFTITGENETKYLWIYPVMDNAGNINDGKSDINTPYVLSTITFKDKTYLYDVLQKEAASGSGLAQLYTGQHNDTYNEIGTQNIYHFYGADSTAATSVFNKNNVLFGGFCWQMIRTTDTGGVKLIYNGKLKEEFEIVTIGESEYNVVSNDTTYPYTYDSNTNTWRSTVHKHRMSGIIKFTIKTAGDYYLNYTVSSEVNDKATFYKNGIQIGQYSGNYFGDVTGTIKLEELNTTDEIKVVYSKDNSGSSGNDNVEFSISKPVGEAKYTCNNSGEEQEIGMSSFNENYDSPAYVGYMYNTVYLYQYKEISSSDVYKYANSFTYSNGTYVLSSDAISIDVTNSTERAKANNAHYTCFNTTGECETIYYIYNYDSYTSYVGIYYVELNNGTSIEEMLQEMLYADDVNQTNSTIKDVIDTWYENNMISYTKYLEDTVFCNDRSISDYGGWNPNGGSLSDYLEFKEYGSLDLYCANITDRFSVENEKAKLSYKVGLMSTPEMNLLGIYYMRKTGNRYWLTSPYIFDVRTAHGYFVSQDGDVVGTNFVRISIGVRPSISLKPNIEYSSGTGSTTDPYVILENK